MKTLIFVFATLLSFNASAIVITHGSSGGTFTQNNGLSSANSSNFDRAEFNFAQEYVDTITLGNFGVGLAHDHNISALAEVDVFDGSNWINVFASSLGGSNSSITLASLFASPISFSGMNISGLRLDASQPVNQMYHNVNSGMTYTLTGAVSSVPEPATLGLLGLGLIGLGIGRRRKLSH